MLRRTGWLVVICLAMTMSCKHSTTSKEESTAANECAKQCGEEGVMLKIEDADLVQDTTHPESNTAEWSFSVDKVGRYEVWLSSITCDTMNLGFDTAVTITAGDSRLQKMPIGDDIITDNNVQSPWFRADSQMGTIFFGKPGEYLVQVISEKVTKGTVDSTVDSAPSKTLIKSVILKPVI